MTLFYRGFLSCSLSNILLSRILFTPSVMRICATAWNIFLNVQKLVGNTDNNPDIYFLDMDGRSKCNYYVPFLGYAIKQSLKKGCNDDYNVNFRALVTERSDIFFFNFIYKFYIERTIATLPSPNSYILLQIPSWIYDQKVLAILGL